MQASQVDIDSASRFLKDWLSEGAFLNGDSAEVPDKGHGYEIGTLVDLFFEIAKKRGFSLGLASSGGHFTGRWSHPSVRTTRIRTASPAATKEHAKLLACVDLLRDAECSSHVAGI
jgi:hypothetical protein